MEITGIHDRFVPGPMDIYNRGFLDIAEKNEPFRPILDIYFLLLKSTFRYIKISGKPYKITMSLTLAKSRNRKLNCSPSRGQRKNIKFSRPAAKCCWPLFMQQGTTCVFLSASVRPSYAGLFWCCNNGCSTQSFARVPVCW